MPGRAATVPVCDKQGVPFFPFCFFTPVKKIVQTQTGHFVPLQGHERKTDSQKQMAKKVAKQGAPVERPG